MINDIKNILARSDTSLAQDFVGAVALIVMLVVGLYLPGMT